VKRIGVVPNSPRDGARGMLWLSLSLANAVGPSVLSEQA